MSNIIKSRNTALEMGEKKPIEVFPVKTPEPPEDEESKFYAASLIEKARTEAESILQEAKNQQAAFADAVAQDQENWLNEMQALSEQAFQEGYAEGMEQGRREGLLQYHSQLEEARQTTALSKLDYLEKIDSSQGLIVDLAVKLAEKIISQELASNKESFTVLVKQLIKEVKEYKEIKLFVHPEQLSMLLQQKDELKQLLTSNSDLYIYADEELISGGCFVETSFGRIDASIDTQLQQLKKQLIEMLGEDE
ncbi:flagellar assembly protein FliH [Metabacillus sp. RGM 3146]|uniref:flagellar assembly protein FliH n=1 Tax=Metabacillus sp. RGM 3146 TaxID=3401092 RepID=UPI003B995088